jgi:hypothetical protein
MRQVLELASVPGEEHCEQLGPNYRPEQAAKECNAFIGQLERQFGKPPKGALLFVRSNPHDFGTYLEVAVRFDDLSLEAVEYAYMMEGDLPLNWDDIARAELGLPSVESILAE